jgi:hypothetical protein
MMLFLTTKPDYLKNPQAKTLLVRGGSSVFSSASHVEPILPCTPARNGFSRACLLLLIGEGGVGVVLPLPLMQRSLDLLVDHLLHTLFVCQHFVIQKA